MQLHNSSWQWFLFTMIIIRILSRHKWLNMYNQVKSQTGNDNHGSVVTNNWIGVW